MTRQELRRAAIVAPLRTPVAVFGGTYRHTLVRTPQGLRIQLQRVDLMNGQAVYDYVLQAWV